MVVFGLAKVVKYVLLVWNVFVVIANCIVLVNHGDPSVKYPAYFWITLSLCCIYGCLNEIKLCLHIYMMGWAAACLFNLVNIDVYTGTNLFNKLLQISTQTTVYVGLTYFLSINIEEVRELNVEKKLDKLRVRKESRNLKAVYIR